LARERALRRQREGAGGILRHDSLADPIYGFAKVAKAATVAEWLLRVSCDELQLFGAAEEE